MEVIQLKSEELTTQAVINFQEAVKNGIISNNGGGELAAKNDLEFFRLSGQLRGEVLKVEDFWESMGSDSIDI